MSNVRYGEGKPEESTQAEFLSVDPDSDIAGQTGDSKMSESQITSLPMRRIFALLKALPHERAALRAGEMGVIPAGRPHELAHLLKS